MFGTKFSIDVNLKVFGTHDQELGMVRFFAAFERKSVHAPFIWLSITTGNTGYVGRKTSRLGDDFSFF